MWTCKSWNYLTFWTSLQFNLPLVSWNVYFSDFICGHITSSLDDWSFQFQMSNDNKYYWKLNDFWDRHWIFMSTELTARTSSCKTCINLVIPAELEKAFVPYFGSVCFKMKKCHIHYRCFLFRDLKIRVYSIDHKNKWIHINDWNVLVDQTWMSDFS